MSALEMFVRLREREFVVVEQKRSSAIAVAFRNFRDADSYRRRRIGSACSSATGAEQGDEGCRRRCRSSATGAEQGDEGRRRRRRAATDAAGACEEEVRHCLRKKRRRRSHGKGGDNEKDLPSFAADAGIIDGYTEKGRALGARVRAVWQIATWCGVPRRKLAERACINRDELPFGEVNDKLNPWMCIDVRGLFPYDKSPCECGGLGPIQVCHGTRNLQGILLDRGRLKPGPALIGGQAGVRHDVTWWRPLSYSEPQLIGTCSFYCVLEIKIPSTRVGISRKIFEASLHSIHEAVDWPRSGF